MKSLKSTFVLFFAVILMVGAQTHFELDKDFQASNIAFDQQGNKIVVGSLNGEIDFDPDSGEFLLGPPSSIERPAAIASYSSTNELNFAIELSDADINPNVIIESLSTDANNNIYVHGLFIGKADFDPGPAIFELTAASVFEYRSFTASYDPEGNFRYAYELPPNSLTFGISADVGIRQALLVDAAGNSYLLYRPIQAPVFDADPGPGEILLEFGCYVLSYDSEGNFRFAVEVPRNTNSIGINPDGDFTVTGAFSSLDTNLDLDPGPGVTMIEDASNSVFFIGSYSNTGNLNFAYSIEGSGFATSKIIYSPQNELILVGKMRGTIDFDPSEGQSEVSLSTFEIDPSGDLFFAKYTANGNLIEAFAMEDKVGQVSTEVIYDLDTDHAGRFFVHGQLNNGRVDFDPSEGEAELWGGNNSIEYVACYDMDFNLQFLHSYDYIGYDYGQLAIASNCPFYSFIARVFTSAPLDIDPGPGLVELANNVGAYVTIQPEELDNPNNCSLTITSASEEEFEPIQIYPNPVRSELTIDLGNAKTYEDVKVFNLLGQQVFQKKVRHSKLQLDMSPFPNGTYFLYFISKNGIKNRTQQIVKHL